MQLTPSEGSKVSDLFILGVGVPVKTQMKMDKVVQGYLMEDLLVPKGSLSKADLRTVSGIFAGAYDETLKIRQQAFSAWRTFVNGASFENLMLARNLAYKQMYSKNASSTSAMKQLLAISTNKLFVYNIPGEKVDIRYLELDFVRAIYNKESQKARLRAIFAPLEKATFDDPALSAYFQALLKQK
jgi:hypothetical protein